MMTGAGLQDKPLLGGKPGFYDEVVLVLYRQRPGKERLKPRYVMVELTEEILELRRLLYGVC